MEPKSNYPSEMVIAFGRAITSLSVLRDVWDEAQVKHYPSYLPSFDVFVADLTVMLDDDPQFNQSRAAREMNLMPARCEDPNCQKTDWDEGKDSSLLSLGSDGKWRCGVCDRARG